jgi:hypothetical protein
LQRRQKFWGGSSFCTLLFFLLSWQGIKEGRVVKFRNLEANLCDQFIEPVYFVSRYWAVILSIADTSLNNLSDELTEAPTLVVEGEREKLRDCGLFASARPKLP